MNKPEKKKLSEGQIWLIKMTRKNSCDCDYGYNQSCDEWEAFLPDRKEIYQIILKVKNRDLHSLEEFTEEMKIAKMIAKRISK